MSLVQYQRTGGHSPRNDELLVIETDGAFTLRRVVGGTRVGEFAGVLPENARKAIERSLQDSGLEAPAPPDDRMPPVVFEYVTAEGLSAELSPEGRIKNKPLAALVRRLRDLAEDLTAHPAHALECTVATDAKAVHLRSISSSRATTVRSGKLTFDLFGEQEEFLSAGKLDSPFPGSDPTEIPPNWNTKIDLPADLAFTPKCTLQVRFTFAMQYADGIWRDAQITAVAGKGWF